MQLLYTFQLAHVCFVAHEHYVLINLHMYAAGPDNSGRVHAGQPSECNVTHYRNGSSFDYGYDNLTIPSRHLFYLAFENSLCKASWAGAFTLWQLDCEMCATVQVLAWFEPAPLSCPPELVTIHSDTLTLALSRRTTSLKRFGRM